LPHLCVVEALQDGPVASVAARQEPRDASYRRHRHAGQVVNLPIGQPVLEVGHDTPAVDECLEDGEPCSFAEECCGGFCLPNADGELVCGSECVPVDGACTADVDCCDGVCIDGVCQDNYTDCVPIGGACVVDEDCCDGNCDEEAGLCLPIIT